MSLTPEKIRRHSMRYIHLLSLLETAGGMTTTGKKRKTPINDKVALGIALSKKKLPDIPVRIGDFFKENAVLTSRCRKGTALRVLWHAYNNGDDFSYLMRANNYVADNNTLPPKILKIFVAHFLTGPMTAITAAWPLGKKQSHAAILINDVMNCKTHDPTPETIKALKHVLSLPINATVNWRRKP